MARKDHTKETLEQGLEMGKENASIIPEIRNWCRHIVLTDQSAGMLHEYYGVPTNTAVSCPHARGGSSGMNLNWIAGSFIVENCIGCSFHQQISEPNFGTRILEEKSQAEEEERINQQKKEETHRQLKELIDVLVKAKMTTVRTTELSILRLAEDLDNPGKKIAAASKLYESAKLEPGFFSAVCLKILSLHFEDEKIGETCLKIVSEIFKTQQHFPEDLFHQALKVLTLGKNFNGVALLFSYYINAGNIKEHESAIRVLIECLTYTRDFPVPEEQPKNHADSIKALHFLISVDRGYMHALFQLLVLLEDSMTRINICGILQDLMVNDNEFVLGLVPELVQSFENIENAQYNSADLATATTLGKLIKASPDTVYRGIKERISRLKDPGRGGAVRLYSYLMDDQEFILKKPDFNKEITRELIGMAMNKNETYSLHELYIDEVYGMRFENINLLEPNFDTLVGWLSRLIEDEKTFLYWKDEIEKKKPEEWATFNPLRGKDYWGISSERNRISKEIHKIQDIIRDIIKEHAVRHLETVKKIIAGLDSAMQPKFKAVLISIVSNSISDSYLLSEFIPSLYNYLFDPHSVEVRDEAMKFLNRLAENNPELITQTLLDLTDIFLKDPEVAVRGIALETQETLLEKVPTKFNYGNIDIIIKALSDPYVYIHKKAARISETFFPVMGKEQKWATLILLQSLLSHYKSKEDDFAKDCLKILLRITGNYPRVFKKLVEDDVIGFCRKGEWHDRKEFIELLGEICRKHPEYEDNWLKIVIDLLKIIQPGMMGDMDWRAETFKEMHKLSYGCMIRNISIIDEFLESRRESEGFDIVHMLHVLCYFEFHDKVISYGARLNSKVPLVTATEGIFRHAELLNHFATFEKGLAEGESLTDKLKAIKDVLPKTES